MGRDNFIWTICLSYKDKNLYLLSHEQAPENWQKVQDLIKTLATRCFQYYTSAKEMVNARKEMYERICNDYGHPKHGVLYTDLNKISGCAIDVQQYLSVDYGLFADHPNVLTFSEIHDSEHLQHVADLPLTMEQVDNV